MKIRTVLLLLAVLALSAIGGEPALAEQENEFVVVVNTFNPFVTIAEEDLAQIFLKKRATWSNEQEAFPVDQAETSDVRRHFVNRVLKKDVESLKRYWQQQVFTGKAVPPPALGNDAAVIEFVRSHPYGVGYVSRGVTLGENVRAIAVRK